MLNITGTLTQDNVHVLLVLDAC